MRRLSRLQRQMNVLGQCSTRRSKRSAIYVPQAAEPIQHSQNMIIRKRMPDWKIRL